MTYGTSPLRPPTRSRSTRPSRLVTVQGGSPDVSTISKIATKDTVTIVWQCDRSTTPTRSRLSPLPARRERRYADPDHRWFDQRVRIDCQSAAATNVTTTIKGADLETAAVRRDDGAKIIKIFVQDDSGNWSV